MGGLVNIGAAAIGLGSSGYLIGDAIRRSGGGDSKNAFDTDIPQVKTDRGDQLPSFLGRAQVAPVFMGELSLRTAVESSSVQGAKGGLGSAGGVDNEVTFGRALMGVCVGPARRLRQVEKNGEVIWPIAGQFVDGITPETHPSGSRLALGGDPASGSMVIYWGERDQPLNASATQPGRFPVETTLPFVCYIYFDELRLGAVETWPSVLVDIERAPYIPANLVGTTYADLYAQHPLVVGDPWFRNGFKIDKTKTGDALLYDEVAGTIKVGGDLTPLDRYALRYTGADIVLGNASSATYNPAEVIQVPAVQRLSAITLDDWSTANTLNANLSPVAGPTVPGVVNDPTLLEIATLTTFATGANRWHALFGPLAASPVPPGGGVFNDAGNGFVFGQIYLNPSTLTGTTTFDIVFNNESNLSNPLLSAARGSVIVGPNSVTVLGNSGVGFSIQRRSIGNGWFEVIAYAEVQGNNALAPADPYFFGMVGNFNAGNGLVVAGGTGVDTVSAPAMLSTSASASYTGITTITTDLDLRSFDDFAGEVSPYVADVEGGDHGVNAAHAIYEYLFHSAPHGLGLDTAPYAINTLQAVAILLTAEGLRAHVEVQDYKDVSAALSQLMLDVGIEQTFDITTGRIRWDLRRDQGEFARVPQTLLVERPVAATRRLEGAASERVSFSYRVAADRYSTQTVGFSVSGDTQNGGYAGVSPDSIDSARDVEAGQRMAAIRAGIELSRPSVFQMKLTRDAVTLRPPDILDVSPVTGFNGKHRVLSVRGQPKSSEVEVSVYPETVKFGAVNLLTSSLSRESSDDSDLAQDAANLYLDTAGGLLPLRLRGDYRATRGLVQGSNDGTGFWSVGVSTSAGGGSVVSIDGTTILFRTEFSEDLEDLLNIPATALASGILQVALDDGTLEACESLTDMGDGLWSANAVTGTLPVSADHIFIWKKGTESVIESGLATDPGRVYKTVPLSRRKVGNVSAAPADTPVTP